MKFKSVSSFVLSSVAALTMGTTAFANPTNTFTRVPVAVPGPEPSLDTYTAWDIGTLVLLPGITDLVKWDASSATVTNANNISADVYWGGILDGSTGALTIGGGQSINLGQWGITTTTAGALNINNKVNLAASQTWTLDNTPLTMGANIDLLGNTLTYATTAANAGNSWFTVNSGYTIRDSSVTAGNPKTVVTVNTPNGGTFEMKGSIDSSSVRLSIVRGNVTFHNNALVSADIELPTDATGQITWSVGSDKEYTGTLTGAGTLSIAAPDATRLLFNTANPAFTGTIRTTGGTGNYILGNNTAFGIGPLRVENTYGAAIISNIPNLVMANSKYYIYETAPFKVSGGGNVTIGSAPTAENPLGKPIYSQLMATNNSRSITFTNNLNSGAVFTIAGDIRSNEAGDWSNANVPLNFYGTGTTLVTGTIYNAGIGAGTRAVVVKDGMVTVAGASLHKGFTQVSDGATLIVNGNWSVATGAVTVAAGSTLGGTGTLGGAVTFSTGSKFLLLEDSNSSKGLTFLGGLTFESALTLTLTGEGWSYNPDATWVVFNSATDISSSLLLDSSFPSGTSIQFDAANSKIYIQGLASAIPEPASLVLLGLGLGMVALLRRKKLS